MAAAGIWKESFRVRSYETDPNGRISVATVCNYLQEAAGNHAFERAVPELSSRLPEPVSETEYGPTSVRYGDLDVNGHVNNVRYVEWALDAMDVERLSSSRLNELEIHCKAEAVLGDRVYVLAGAVGEDRHEDAPGTVLAHVIMQSARRKELARLRTEWTTG